MPNVDSGNAGSATVVVQMLTGIDSLAKVELTDKFKCLFGIGGYKYSTGYAKIGENMKCFWNRSATLNIKTDELIKFKIKSKTSSFTCYSSLKVFQINPENSDFIELPCYAHIKTSIWKRRPKGHARTSSTGSLSLDQTSMQILPLKLVVKVFGDIDYFHLNSKGSRFSSIFKRSIVKTPNHRKSLPNTPDHYDLNSISSLASLSAKKKSLEKNVTATPLTNIRKKLSYDSLDSSKNELTISNGSNSLNNVDDYINMESSQYFEKTDEVVSGGEFLKPCCINNEGDLNILQQRVNDMEHENSEIVSAIEILRAKIRKFEVLI